MINKKIMKCAAFSPNCTGMIIGDALPKLYGSG